MPIANIPRRMAHLKQVDPEHLVGDKIQPGHRLFGLVWINPARVSGAPCFFGTRVPIKNLFDCLAAGETIEDFLEGFEGVDREQVEAVVQLSAENLVDELERI